ncbi:MAG: hypothetical protein R3293_28200 [Candidatus Promineifilaceae bacterium]|nr:hypothetical protein [Candidatus Promineifilaceae bacterium]
MMTFDSFVFIAALAIGAGAEVITLKYPTRYRQLSAAGKVLVVAVVVAVMPSGIGMAAGVLLGLLAARLGDVFGEGLHKAIVRFAAWRVGNIEQWDTHQKAPERLRDEQTTQSERI